MTPLEEWATLLDELDLGTYSLTSGGNVFHPTLPATPDLAIAVATYSGGTGDARNGHTSSGVQFRVRGPKTDSRVGEAKAWAIYDALHGLCSRALAGGTWLVLLWCPQDSPNFIGKDSTDRPEWTVNFRAEIQRPTVLRP